MIVYLAVTANDIQSLNHVVNQWIRQGYRPTGGLTHNGNVYAQALIKEKE